MARQTQIGSHKTSIITEDGYTKVIYHSTVVVKFNHDSIILNTGGYHTMSTKDRLNQCSSQFDLGYKVVQRDFCWYVEYHNCMYDVLDNTILNRHNNEVLSSSNDVMQPIK